MLQSLPFLGKFRDLIPLGFKFHKLFAGNHRVYSKTMNPKYIDKSTIWIWQKGCEVEYEDFYGMTADIFRALLDDEKFPWESHGGFKAGLTYIQEWKSKDVVIDRDTNEILRFKLYEHDPMFYVANMYGKNLPRPAELPENVVSDMHEIGRRYRKVNLKDDDLEAVKFLLDNKLIAPFSEPTRRSLASSAVCH